MMLYPLTKLNKLNILSKPRLLESESDMVYFRNDIPLQVDIASRIF